ncbi:sodium:proton antiporter [Hyphococcus luteus]|uniref:Na+/H+ antiporter subunit C n=1 Tax=Hyphococcus luteus TaxID=2058213 RepID=A0A2S7JZY5_9PROT|nr:cation:proton antiporter subunit C [Marinicaulis flavus]PQA85823.1 Na+/H+ antiporter subunit C [Marinicaulis flavus]
MDDWLTFILERYNYWIVIMLMMTGLYIVFARGNLVKKIVGLNIFQTSVFIYYITIGKIVDGTAPIYMGGELEAASHHGGKEAGGAGHGAEAAAHDAAAAGEAVHAKIDNSALDHGQELKDALKHAPAPEEGGSLHELPDAGDKIANAMGDHLGKTPPADASGFDVGSAAGGAHDAAGNAAGGVGDGAADALHGAMDAVVYTNPLPHVLILTAIVVGVATTAVGLALAVRIREAYGTIEEDELEAADEIAEFGHAAGERAQAEAGAGA